MGLFFHIISLSCYINNSPIFALRNRKIVLTVFSRTLLLNFTTTFHYITTICCVEIQTIQQMEFEWADFHTWCMILFSFFLLFQSFHACRFVGLLDGLMVWLVGITISLAFCKHVWQIPAVCHHDIKWLNFYINVDFNIFYFNFF